MKNTQFKYSKKKQKKKRTEFMGQITIYRSNQSKMKCMQHAQAIKHILTLTLTLLFLGIQKLNECNCRMEFRHLKANMKNK